jgi:four helix bundle protein
MEGHALSMRQRPYEKLIAWQRADELCQYIYAVTRLFPMEERFGLVSQMRRSSYSIPMNLAEGNGRRSKKEKSHFVTIAIGSLEELHYQCKLAHKLGYIVEKHLLEADDKIQKVGYLLERLRISLS